MKATLLPLLLLTLALPAQKTFNDVKDFGFTPGVKTFVYTISPGAESRNGEWVTDSLPMFTNISTFNRQGKVLTFKQKTRNSEFTKTYSYDGTRLTAASSGETEYKYRWTDSSFTETEFDRGTKFCEITTVLDKDMLTKREILKTFDKKGVLTQHSVATFHSREKGMLNSWTIQDMLTQSKADYELTVLKRDSLGNPLKVLKKENGKPVRIQTYKYSYWYPERPVRAGINDDPVWAVEAIIEAANTGKYSQLHKLCAPNAQNDHDSEFICSLDTLPARSRNQFIQSFSNSEVDGSPEKIVPDRVLINLIHHTEDGDYKFVLRLKNIAGKWYLL